MIATLRVTITYCQMFCHRLCLSSVLDMQLWWSYQALGKWRPASQKELSHSFPPALLHSQGWAKVAVTTVYSSLCSHPVSHCYITSL